MYILERIEYLPVFNNDKNMENFLNQIRDLITPTKTDNENGSYEKYVDICDFIKNLIDYTQLKTQKEVTDSLYNISKNKRQDELCYRKFKRIAKEINEFIDTFRNGGNYNWLIQIAAYDYASLADLKQLKYIKKNTDKYKNILARTIKNFESAIKIAKSQDINSDKMWLGYLAFNLARAYVLDFEINKNSKDIELVCDYLALSIDIRHSWIIRNPFTAFLQMHFLLNILLLQSTIMNCALCFRNTPTKLWKTSLIILRN